MRHHGTIAKKLYCMRWGDVGDVPLWGDGGMERGDAQIIPTPGVGKVPEKGGK